MWQDMKQWLFTSITAFCAMCILMFPTFFFLSTPLFAQSLIDVRFDGPSLLRLFDCSRFFPKRRSKRPAQPNLPGVAFYINDAIRRTIQNWLETTSQRMIVSHCIWIPKNIGNYFRLKYVHLWRPMGFDFMISFIKAKESQTAAALME